MSTQADADARREARRRQKEAEKEANHARFASEVESLTQPIEGEPGFEELIAEHQRLRGKITEMQQLVITGRFDHALAQEYERRLVGKIHQVEERAHGLQAGGAAEQRPGPPE